MAESPDRTLRVDVRRVIKLERRVDALERDNNSLRTMLIDMLREFRSLSAVVGKVPTPDDTSGSGIASQISHLVLTVGRAPNDATGDAGSGLCKVVAERERRMLRGAAGVAGGTIVAVEGVLKLLEQLGVL